MIDIEKNIYEYVCKNYLNMEPTIPICIPSYKNRPGNIVQNLDLVSNNDIYVFVYEDDYLASAYEQYDNKHNVHFVKLSVDWRTGRRKKNYIQNYMLNMTDVHDYIIIDDDISHSVMWINGKKEKINLKNTLGILEYCVKNSNVPQTYSGFNMQVSFGHWTEDGNMFGHSNIYQVHLINNDFIRKTKLMFPDKDSIIDDNYILYLLRSNNYNVNSLNFGIIVEQKLKTLCASTPDKYNQEILNTYRLMNYDKRIKLMVSKRLNGNTLEIMNRNIDYKYGDKLKELAMQNKTDKEIINDLIDYCLKLKQEKIDKKKNKV